MPSKFDKRTTARITAELETTLKDMAEKLDVSPSDIVRHATYEFINENKDKNRTNLVPVRARIFDTEKEMKYPLVSGSNWS